MLMICYGYPHVDSRVGKFSNPLFWCLVYQNGRKINKGLKLYLLLKVISYPYNVLGAYVWSLSLANAHNLLLSDNFINNL